MREFLKTVPGRLCTLGAICLLLAGLAFGGRVWWDATHDAQFQGLTIELGQPLPAVSAFVAENAQPENPRMVTPAAEIDLKQLGEQLLDFASSIGRETVTLTIVDTVAPQVTFRDLWANLDTELKPEDFVQEVSDQSAVTVTFAQPLSKPETYGEAQVQLLVTDAAGNETAGTCMVRYGWIYPAVSIELGQKLTKADLLLSPEKDADLLDQAQLDKINASPAGTYTVTSINGDLTSQCSITVADTTAPELKLKAVKMDSNEILKIKDFIASVSDASGKVTTAYVTEPNPKELGTQTVTIVATDPSGNTTTAETTLKVSYDTTPPKFSGMSAMTVKKGASPNYTKGVKAKDSRDGTVKFTVDTSRVNTDKTGTYYAVYTATDSSGNKATYRRKITVGHGPEDTAALIKATAAKLSNDPVAISKWIRDNVKYSNKSGDWGGDDPVWYGLKNKRGNCYVHAKILEALLKEKGFSTQIIHVNEIKYFSNAKANKPSHYWNLVYVNGVWRHIDSTPGTKHPAYLMTDEQRYKNLQGRDWDRDKWPKCE